MKKLLSFFAAALFATSLFAENITIAKSVNDLFPNDENGTQEAVLYEDTNLKISVNPDGNNGKIYGTGTEWRLYQSNNAVVTVEALNGAELVQIGFTFDVTNDGKLFYGSAEVASESILGLKGTKAEFTVGGGTNGKTNGQVRIKEFKIVVSKEGDTPEPPQPSLKDGFYLSGTFNAWAVSEDYMFVENPATPGEYMIDVTLAVGDELKGVIVVSGAEQWVGNPKDNDNNFKVDAEHAGDVTIYLNPAGNAAWEWTFIYIEVKETPPTPQPQGDELWVETFDRNGTYVAKKNGTYWPYANEWFTGYPVSETENVEGNQYTNDYSDVESNGVSIRSKKINGGDAVPGLYFAMNKEAAKNYVKFIGKPLFDASDKNYEYTLNFTICLPESADGGDLKEMNIYMNGLGLALLPKDTKLGDKLVTTDVAVPLENMKINNLQFDFDNTATQKFISKIWITAEKKGDTPQPQLEDGFYLVGTMNDWTPEASMMFVANEEVEGEYVFFWTGEEGQEMKVVEVKDNEIAGWYPGGENNNFVVSDELVGQLMTIHFDPAGHDTWTDFGGFCKVEIQGNPEPEAEFYLVGDFTEWALDEKGDYKLEANPNAEGEYMLEMFLVKGEQFKAVEVKDNEIVRWYPEGEGNNITFDAAEEAAVVIYFRPAGNTDWELDPFYIEVKETPQPQGGEITITPENCGWSATAGEQTGTVQGVTVATTQGLASEGQDPNQMRAYKGKTFTVSAEANIIKIVITCTASGEDKYGPGCFTVEDGKYSYEENVGTWVGKAKEVVFTASTFQVRMTSVVVTLEGGEEEKLADGFYLAGDFNNWTPTANDVFFINEEVVTLVEYMKHAYLTEGEGIKVVEYKDGEAANWYPDGMGNEYKVDAAHAGEVDIYFRTEYQDDWAEFGGYMYITEGQSTIITLDVEYGSAVYVDDEQAGTFWQFNLFKDYDATTGVVTYPDFYIGVAPKSATAIAGTYGVEEIYFVEVDLDANTAVYATQASDLVVTHNEQGVYHFEFDFIGEDGNTYMVNAEVPVEAYDYASGEEIELVEEDTPVVLADGYYLAGDFNKWEVSADYMFKANPEAEGEYMLDVTLAEGDELKGVIVAFGQIVQWVGNPKDGGNNFKVDAEHAGDVTIYLNPAGRSDWEWTYIYIEVHAQPEYLTCADVLEIAATMEDPTADNKYVYGEEVVVRAYVQFAYDPKEQQASPVRKALQQSVWLNDDKAATKGQIQVYYGSVEEALAKGDYVEAKGQVTKYFKGEGNIIVELLNGEMKKITDTPTGVENVETSVEVLKTIRNGQFIIIRNGQSFNATGARIQ